MSDNHEFSNAVFLDAVTEILNIGIGSAGSVLSEMVNDDVKLTVPGVMFISQPDALQILEQNTQQAVSGVSQHFSGMMTGDVLLLFPEANCLKLVRTILQQDISLDDLTEMEQEAMTEIGNVILNSCLCSIADRFKQQITSGIPEFLKSSLSNILFNANLINKVEACVLLLNVEFSIATNQIDGYVSVVMDIESMAFFKQNIEQYYLQI
ncbi:chemotaxis protein CheC [Methylomonas sp. AM2-LC]|uniref:chemotaxis protein CheC n=1 Tax=Methylomonas sp. AM2-LC TaxID=3153301 RepID=UPI0032645BB3